MNEPKQIPLSKGLFALVSIEDYEMVNRYKWHVTSHGYAARHGQFGVHCYLHREINKTPEGMLTDHIDRNKLNCTRENLRTVTPLQNSKNQTKQSRSTSSQFKGVCFIPGRGADKSKNSKWSAYITHECNRTHIGHFVTELDAAFAYNIVAKEKHGEFASLNPLPMDYLASHSEPERFRDRVSQFRGVYFHKATNLWVSRLVRGDMRHHTYHKTEEEAALKWNEVALQHGVPESKLNQVYAT